MSEDVGTVKCGSLSWKAADVKTGIAQLGVDATRPPSGWHKTPDGLRDLEGPIGRLLGRQFMPAAYRASIFRDGIGFKGSHIKRFMVCAAWAQSTENALMNIVEQLEGNYEAAEKLWSQYKDRLTAFRSAVKNDVVSLEASSRKTTEATQKMKAAFGQVIDLLNSESMLQAVANAERLASAMTALANLHTHKLIFAVTDQSQEQKQ